MNDSTANASSAAEDQSAPLVVRSGGDAVAGFGALMTAIVAGVVWVWPGAPAIWALILVALVFAVCVLWPLSDYLLNVVVCDDKGLIFGGLWRKRRIAFSEIEALYLLTNPDANPDNAGLTIVAKGLPIGLTGTPDERSQMITRIERGAQLPLEKRDFLPLVDSFALPATFDYSDKRSPQRVEFAVGVALHLGLWALLLRFANWNVWTPWLLAALLSVWQSQVWPRYFRSHRRRKKWRRERAGERIVADEMGLTFSRAGTPDARFHWEQIMRLERDCARSQWERIHRVQGYSHAREQVITFYGFDNLTRLLRERCDLKWQETPHYQRVAYGISRRADALVLSADRESATFQRRIWLTLWQYASQIWLVSASWNVAVSWPLGIEWLLACLTPPLSIPLGLAIAVAISQRRVWTRCDDNGLTHQGWGRARSLKWDEIEAGGESPLWDWVRSRDGRAIRISHWPIFGGEAGRQKLRAEIERRAPHANFNWDFCENKGQPRPKPKA